MVEDKAEMCGQIKQLLEDLGVGADCSHPLLRNYSRQSARRSIEKPKRAVDYNVSEG